MGINTKDKEMLDNRIIIRLENYGICQCGCLYISLVVKNKYTKINLSMELTIEKKKISKKNQKTIPK